MEIDRLPAVDEDGPADIAVFPAADVSAQEAVILMRERLKPLIAVGEKDFRRGKDLTRLKLPRKRVVLDTEHKTRRLTLVTLQLDLVAAGVDEHRAEACACGLACFRLRKDHKRVVLVAACTARGLDDLNGIADGEALNLTFHAVPARGNGSAPNRRRECPDRRTRPCGAYMPALRGFEAAHNA